MIRKHLTMHRFTCWLVLLAACLAHSTGDDGKIASTGLAKDIDDPLLLLSTLDGTMYGIGEKSGQIRWSFKDEPVVKVPLDTSQAITPLFLPDPKDGSLYLLGGGERDALKKLPFTIPQLVATSPCRSSDGILYTGRKRDVWFALDPATGSRRAVLGFEPPGGATCPVPGGNQLLVGRTEYNILMADSATGRQRWNITFYGYSAAAGSKGNLLRQEVALFAGSGAGGEAALLDRRGGQVIWRHDLGSPVVAAFHVAADGLIAAPFTSVGDETLGALAEIAQPPNAKLYPTLFIGEHTYGLYALPSLVDDKTVTISTLARGPYLLEGPSPALPDTGEPVIEGQDTGSVSDEGQPTQGGSGRLPLPGNNFRLPNNEGDTLTFQSLPKTGHGQPVIILGHYKVPEYSATRMQITGRSDLIIPPTSVAPEPSVEHAANVAAETNATDGKRTDAGAEFILSVLPREKADANTQTESQTDIDWNKVFDGNVTFIMSSEFVALLLRGAKTWASRQENKLLKLSLLLAVGLIFAMLWHLHLQVRQVRQLSQGSRSSSTGGRHGDVTAPLEDLGGGDVRVGKITFSLDTVLGKGCEGTFVYRGEFDGRAVAVKRLLPECFSFADREVDLLRQSDQHPNVVRYFCTEQDKQFRYIALELCDATLQDFVEGRFRCEAACGTDILKQSTAGLAHLHSLDIVHRDVKPHNVLLSSSSTSQGGGALRAMISDFGLCKKLQRGRVSFSRRSGATGTDGWIAPEMMDGAARTTCAVDIFSLGCVFYYVLSGGKHPFGDVLRRQSNILSGEPKLADLPTDSVLAASLVEAMIQRSPHERPAAEAVLAHPLFWDATRALGFLQDVSDRVEKEDTMSATLAALETGGSVVLGDDWRTQIDAELAADLRRFRNYRGDSVRDLLRALRNKKHHYREQSEHVQSILGAIPNEFTAYWTHRFPSLLVHTWLAMQCVKHEPIFEPYFPATFRFPVPSAMKAPEKPAASVGWVESFRKSPEKQPWKGRAGFWRQAGASEGNWREEGEGSPRKGKGVTWREGRVAPKKGRGEEVPLVWGLPPS